MAYETTEEEEFAGMQFFNHIVSGSEHHLEWLDGATAISAMRNGDYLYGRSLEGNWHRVTLSGHTENSDTAKLLENIFVEEHGD